VNTSGSYHAIAGGKKMKIKKPKIKAAIKSIKPIGGGRGGGSIKMPKMAAAKMPSFGGGKRKKNML
jgi:hypothetical protein